jgi:hypothetical protein
MRKFFEPLIWTSALIFLFIDPVKDEFSFCVFKLIGFKSCIGCGIGHSIHSFLHLHIAESFSQHILGIPATIVALYIITKTFFSTLKKNQNGSTTDAYDVTGIGTR